MEILNYIFLISFIFIVITLPFLLIFFVFYILSSKFKFTFKINGFYKISNILFEYHNELIKIQLKIEKIELILIWLRLRLLISGIDCQIEIENNHCDKKIKSLILGEIREKINGCCEAK